MPRDKGYSPAWTKKRQKAVVRRKDGTFKVWKGGKRKQDLKKKRNNFHGIAIHLGKEFSRQHGRPAKVGEIVRKEGNKNRMEG